MQDTTDFCSTSFKVEKMIQYHKHNLSTELARRTFSGMYFEENALWEMVDRLCLGLEFLQKQGRYHGDVRPLTISITGDGKFLLSDHMAFSNGLTQFHKALLG